MGRDVSALAGLGYHRAGGAGISGKSFNAVVWSSVGFVFAPSVGGFFWGIFSIFGSDLDLLGLLSTTGSMVGEDPSR